MGNRRNPLLYPLSILYRLVTDFRNFLYDTGIYRSEEFDIPLICIGNITVGGTGKTPHTEYLIDLLRKDFKVAVLSRGYKRKSKGFIIASPSSTVSETGDEPLQIFHKFPEIVVAVDNDRVNGIKGIMKTHPETGVIILDDSFQHRKVKSGFSVLLTDHSRLITTDYLMPYGRLREKPENRKRADVIIVSKTPANISQSAMNAITTELEPYEHQKVYFSSVKYRDLTPVFPDHAREKLKLRQPFGSNSGAVLITGIASPGLLKTFLQGFFQEIIHLDFPDHHYFRENDIEKIRRALKKLKSTRRLLITTEKDAVRLREFPELEDPEKRNLYFVPMEISFIKDENHEFDNLIIGYVRENKRDNWVS